MSQSGILNFDNMSPTLVVETLTGNSGGVVGPTGNNINVVGDGITATVVGNPGTSTLTISALGATVETIPYTGVNHAASPYTALSTDYYIAADVTAGVITIKLPNAPATGRVFIIKDKAGLSAVSNITITTVGGVITLDGNTTFIMNTAYESIQFVFNGTNYEGF
jgi:hypothetical protein